MRVRLLVLAVLCAVAAPLARTAAGQSLADVARRESERRKDVKEPVKTFTNADLPNAPAPSSAATAAAAEPATAGNDDKARPAAGAKEAGAADKSKDPKYWGDKIKTLRDKLDADKVLADALQSRIDALWTDFVNRDDPAQRAVIGQNRQKALDQLATLKQTVADDTKAISDFEEEARKAGVPPGWLR